MRTQTIGWLLSIGAAILLLGSSLSRADDVVEKAGAPAAKLDPALYQKTVERGARYLLDKGAAPDGSYSAPTSPAVTAICVAALLRSGHSPDEPAIAKSLKYLEGFVQSDGGVYKPGSAIQNYETGIAIMCFAEANKDGRYKDQIKAAENYVKSIQWGANELIDPSDMKYGGAGYGRGKTRPDLSNTSFLLDALQAAGAESDDIAVQRALVFVSRCQNLESQYNTTELAKKNPDGGFFYTIAEGGTSMAGDDTLTGGKRSYGSMTYAGLKSMIFAGLKPDDKRVKAAVDWVRKHYDLSSNPGMGQAGLFYGYHTFSKALEALGQDPFVDDKGVAHPWRAELVAELAKRQQPDGSWVNTDKRFMESDPNLVTGFALLTLSHCKPPQK
jgi:squalene-hopene/tetraprenyl-beta-curcumene cyclase